jgi:hypothetical protein
MMGLLHPSVTLDDPEVQHLLDVLGAELPLVDARLLLAWTVYLY